MFTLKVVVIILCHETNYRENEIRFQICFENDISYLQKRGKIYLFPLFLLCNKENWDTKNWRKKVGLIKRKTNGGKKPNFF